MASPARHLEGIKIEPVRMAYDMLTPGIRRAMEASINRLAHIGIRRRKIIVYVLYNFTDTPDSFFQRVRDLLHWGAVAYPMRFEPLDSLEKNKYIACEHGWTKQHLEMVADARRVIGCGGAFPPYEGLRKKFNDASDFFEAFELRPVRAEEDDEFALDHDLKLMGQDHEFPMRSLVEVG